MQTFLPFECFQSSAKVLDQKRLGKQRVEVLQLLNAISKIKNKEPVRGWKNHPCTRMWKDYSNALVFYGVAICTEWINRCYNDTCLDKINFHYNEKEPMVIPKWLGNPDLHLSHKSNLIQKDPFFYGNMWPNVPNNLEYVWPE
jgi:hypothetical protein